MDIRPLDLDDDVEFERFHQVMESAERFERPAAAMWSLDEARVTFREHQPGERCRTVVSLSSRGHRPTEWWISAPAAGQSRSTSRIRAAPTTQVA